MRAHQAAPLAEGEQPDPAATIRAAKIRARMVPPFPGTRFWGWAGPALVTLFGAFLRFDRLGVPRGVVFDETYYVPDAYSILRHGVEINHAANVDALLARGSTQILLGTQGEYVAHPPLGKIMIAAGEWLFGLTPFGWRFTAAVVGTLAILMTARIARRMTRSTLLGCIAGLLLALDGLEFVLSRTAILDIFVMFWVLAAFGLILIDRDRSRARLAAAASTRMGASAEVGAVAGAGAAANVGAAAGAGAAANVGAAAGAGSAAGASPVADIGAVATVRRDDTRGPRLGFRWLLILAGICLGCACACKWSGVWYIPAFGGLVIAWDLGARRAAGFTGRLRGAARSDLPWLPVWFGIAPAAAYVVSWTGWFATSYGYDRTGALLNGGHPTSTLMAWLQYNKSMLSFGLGLRTYQFYHSNPLAWLVVARPISFYSICLPARGCGGTGSTEQEVLAIGTPLIWWASVLALVACLAWWVIHRDWRAGTVLVAVAAGWLPWIWFYYHDHRTEFYYYAVIFDPFLVIAITLCLGLIIGPARADPSRRMTGALATGAYLLAVLGNFAYLYPILAGRVIPYTAWLSRMWFHSWI